MTIPEDKIKTINTITGRIQRDIKLIQNQVRRSTEPNDEPELTVELDVSKFKEILIHSWHLLPAEKQEELHEMGVFKKQ